MVKVQQEVVQCKEEEIEGQVEVYEEGIWRRRVCGRKKFANSANSRTILGCLGTHKSMKPCLTAHLQHSQADMNS